MFRKLVFALLLILGISFAATQVTNCMNITSPGYYYMGGDITNASPASAGGCIGGNACFIIKSDNVTFNCDHHTITSGSVIFEVNGSNNLTVANCTMDAAYGKTVALGACWSNDSRWENLDITSNHYSVYFTGTNHTYFYNLTIRDLGVNSQWHRINNLTLINVTGLSPGSSQNYLYFEDVSDVYLKDLWNVSVYFRNANTTHTENLYSPDPYQGYGWYLEYWNAPMQQHTLKGAYVSDCNDGGATPCISYDAGVDGVHIEDTELIGASRYTMRANSTHINLTLTNISGIPVYLDADNITVDGVAATTTVGSLDAIYVVHPGGFSSGASNVSVSNVEWHDYSTKAGTGIYVEGDPTSPYTPYDNVTFTNISTHNSGTGAYIGNGAKSLTFDGLVLENASYRGIDIYYSGFQSQCNPPSTFNDVTSDLHFSEVSISGAEQGVYIDDAVCQVYFDGLEVNATDLGFHLEPSPGGGDQGGWQMSVDDFEITVSSASGVGLNLSKNIDSNYTNGEVSGGEYCVWTYRARINQTYDNLTLHDCDTGFLLSNTVHPPAGQDFVNLTGVYIYDVLLDFDTSDFWYLTLFEDTFFGNSSGGLGIEFLTYGCLNLTSTAQPAPLPAGYTEFHGNYLEITPDLASASCSVPGRYAATNETGFIWTAAQEAGYDMSTLKVLKWNGSAWSEVPGTLDLANRIYEVGNMSNFSTFTLAADESSGGGGSSDGSSSRDNGPITLIVPEEAFVLEPVLIQTLDKNGNPLNAKVSVKFGLQTIFYGFVGADGQLQITPTEPGTYSVTASKDNYDAPVPVEFVALLQELEAYVPESVEENEQFDVFVTSTKGPLQGARVEIEGLVKITGEDGAAGFSLPNAGNYQVDITKEGYVPWSSILNVWAEGEEPPIVIPEGPGPVIIEPEPEEPSATPYAPPILQTDVPSVDSSVQPLSAEQMQTQENWLWFVLLFIIVVAGALYWLYAGKKKKHEKGKK